MNWIGLSIHFENWIWIGLTIQKISDWAIACFYFGHHQSDINNLMIQLTNYLTYCWRILGLAISDYNKRLIQFKRRTLCHQIFWRMNLSHPSLEEKDSEKSIRTINGNASCITFTRVCNPSEDWNRQWRFVHGNWNQTTTERDLHNFVV